MILLNDIRDIKETGLVATVGFFDGVHLGHRHLIGQLKHLAGERGLPSAVVTFPVHPRKVLQSDFQPKLLNSFEEKIGHLRSTGADYCIVLDFTRELSLLSAKEFITDILRRQMHVATLLVGHDHRFGHNREDGFDEYGAYGASCGMEVVKASRFTLDGLTVSSSAIRRMLAEGQVAEARTLLDYPYQLKGHIVSGYKIGRTLGFPTANIQVDEPYKALPRIGVYAVRVGLGGKRYGGMLYIGNRPTLHNGTDISLEVNIFDFSESVYNNEITVSFVDYIRDDILFGSLDELKDQLEKDRKTIRDVLRSH